MAEVTTTRTPPQVTAFDGLPAGVVVTDPDLVAGYERDESQFTDAGMPLVVLCPRDTAEVAACVIAAGAAGVPIVVRGAGSGLSGGANGVAGAAVLSLHRMTRIKDVDAVERLAVVEPGVVTSDLRAAAASAGLFYPPDPGSVEWCTVGGNVATNAGGMCCVKYGVTGDFVEALEVVLADGRVMRTGTRTVKSVAGYDLTSLMVGSEGTLGVVTEVTVRLLPAPGPTQTLVASFSSLADAGQAVTAIATAGLVPSLLEILDATTVRAVEARSGMQMGDMAAMLLVQSDASGGPGADGLLAEVERWCTEAGAVDVALSEDAEEGAMLMQARRLALPALEALGDWLLDDVCVPRREVVALIEAVEAIATDLGLTIGVFGHAGDGNLHPTVIFDGADPDSRARALEAFDRITRAALDLGGTVTGEHGVGRLKRNWLEAELDPVALDVQRRVRQALDPDGILNPGVALRRLDDPTG